MNLPAPFKIIFSSSGKKRTIKAVFHEAVNFRWESFNNDFLWLRNS